MFESRSPRNFNSAPQSVTAFIATVLEPAITVLVYLGCELHPHQRIFFDGYDGKIQQGT